MPRSSILERTPQIRPRIGTLRNESIRPLLYTCCDHLTYAAGTARSPGSPHCWILTCPLDLLMMRRHMIHLTVPDYFTAAVEDKEACCGYRRTVGPANHRQVTREWCISRAAMVGLSVTPY